MTVQRVQMPGTLPMQMRAVPISSVDHEARTVDLIYTTGATVRRVRYVGWDTRVPFDETLEVSASAIDATRLDAGAPALDSHSTYSTRSQVGVVERHWIEAGNGWVRIRFPSAGVDPSADRMFSLVQEGIIRNVSVGYSIDKVRVVPATDKQVEQRIVERWTPHEISFVTVGADAGAGVRSADGGSDDAPLYPVDVVNSSSTRSLESVMDETETVNAPAQTAEQTRAAADAAVKAERSRVADITMIAARHNLDATFMQKHISDGTSLDAFRVAVLDQLHETEPTRRVTSSVTVTNPGQAPEMVREAMALGLVMRAGVELRKKDQDKFDVNQLRGFANMSILDLGAELLGISGRMRPVQMFEAIQQRAQMGTTDFPNLLSAAANKMLLSQYEYQAPSYRAFSRKRNFNDFKVHNFLRVGDFPILEPLTETGEFRSGSISENKETVTAATYGKVVNFTRQMMVNDDLGAFSDVTGAAGRRVADFENALAWKIVLANSGAGPTMMDTGSLFNSTAVTTAGGHGNMAGSGAAISIASVDVGRQAIRTQKSLDGVPLNSNPKIMVVGPQQQTPAEQLLSTALLATQISNINVFKDKFDLAVDSYITDKSWYLFADPVAVPTFTWGYVDGFEGPRFAIDSPFKQDGIAFKVVEDFGFGAIDWRGAYRNPGA